ncbi:unnamed protein product [Amoebophrya sp. A25]|nr:unnamed protein product [Amoebophrya sp. A25]|eukprot:GSA25T00004828001.1
MLPPKAHQARAKSRTIRAGKKGIAKLKSSGSGSLASRMAVDANKKSGPKSLSTTSKSAPSAPSTITTSLLKVLEVLRKQISQQVQLGSSARKDVFASTRTKGGGEAFNFTNPLLGQQDRARRSNHARSIVAIVDGLARLRYNDPDLMSVLGQEVCRNLSFLTAPSLVILAEAFSLLHLYENHFLWRVFTDELWDKRKDFGHHNLARLLVALHKSPFYVEARLAYAEKAQVGRGNRDDASCTSMQQITSGGGGGKKMKSQLQDGLSPRPPGGLTSSGVSANVGALFEHFLETLPQKLPHQRKKWSPYVLAQILRTYSEWGLGAEHGRVALQGGGNDQDGQGGGELEVARQIFSSGQSQVGANDGGSSASAATGGFSSSSRRDYRIDVLFRHIGDILALRGPNLDAQTLMLACTSFAQQNIPHGVLFQNAPKLLEQRPAYASISQTIRIAHAYALLGMAHESLFDTLTAKLAWHYGLDVEKDTMIKAGSNSAEFLKHLEKTAALEMLEEEQEDMEGGKTEAEDEDKSLKDDVETSSEETTSPGASVSELSSISEKKKQKSSTTSRSRGKRKKLSLQSLFWCLDAYMRVSRSEPKVLKKVATDLARRADLYQSAKLSREALFLVRNVLAPQDYPKRLEKRLEVTILELEEGGRRDNARMLQIPDHGSSGDKKKDALVELMEGRG